MIANTALPFAVALAIATTSPSPAMQPSPLPSPSAPVATPASSPSPTSAPILAGITLDENANDALRMYGWHQDECASVSGRFACGIPLFSQHVIIVLVVDNRVHVVGVQGSSDPGSHYADPLGIKLGDPVERLTTIRGKPDASYDDSDDLVVRYGPTNGVNWHYKIHDTTIVQIELSDGT